MKIEAIVTDIEGTTSSITFVHDVLFPYARERMADFIHAHGDDPEVRAQLEQVSREAGRPLDDEEAIAQLIAWIDEDRKITPLKTLQGMIWKEGFEAGHFKGHLYPDAFENLQRWHRSGIDLYIFSSGSVGAQKLLFGHSEFGDLTPLFKGYFDTTIGNKRQPEAYTRIIERVGRPADRILFLSDVEEELDAARQAGMETIQLVRDTTPDENGRHRQVADFDQVSAVLCNKKQGEE